MPVFLFNLLSISPTVFTYLLLLGRNRSLFTTLPVSCPTVQYRPQSVLNMSISCLHDCSVPNYYILSCSVHLSSALFVILGHFLCVILSFCISLSLSVPFFKRCSCVTNCLSIYLCPCIVCSLSFSLTVFASV